MTDPRDEEWERRGDRAYTNFTAHPVRTGLKWLLGTIAVIVLISAIFGAVRWATDWGSQPARITGVDNVRKTWTKAYDLDRALTAQARIVCRTAQTSGTADTVSGPALLAVESRYDQIAGEYDAFVSNKLEGGLVLPPNLNSKHTTLEQKLSEIGCTAKIPGLVN